MKRKPFLTWPLAVLLALLPLGSAAGEQGNVPADEDDQAVKGEYVVLFKEGAVEDPDETAERLLRDSKDGKKTFVYKHGFQGFAARGLTADDVAKIREDEVVDVVEPNFIYEVKNAGVQFQPPWGLDRTDQRLLLPNLFYFFDHMGTGTHAYVVDTGILTTHTEFGTRARWLVDCTGTGAFDGHGHGTGMASIVGGTTFGIAKDANLVAVKVLNSSGVGNLAQVLCGMGMVIFDSFFLGNQPAVANMALGGPPSFILNFAVFISELFGIQYNVAAGNGATTACSLSPAQAATPMTVAASDVDLVNTQDVKAPFSNFGTCVDIFAPGVNIPAASSVNNTATQVLTGTSAATAHATGVAAAWREANPALTPAGLKAQILATATAGQISNPMGSPNLLLYKKLVPSPSISQATASQRVHDFVTLSGSGFGAFSPGPTQLFFWDLVTAFGANTPYVWRDGFIQARVPTGNLFGAPTPITKTPQFMVVVNNGDVSNLVPFQVTTANNALSFTELTQIVSNVDVSNVLGSPNFNLRRTKDAEVGDVDGDGFPDLIDNNSVNIRNQHHGVVRFNNFPSLGTKTFSASELEPTDAADTGTYLTTIPAMGTFIEDSTTYDSDLVDLNNDGLPDLVQALRNHPPPNPPPNPFPCPHNSVTQLIRVLMNNNGGPGFFLEDSATWLGSQAFPGAPDDVDHWDVNNDGFVDVGAAYRSFPTPAGGTADIFLNQSGSSFAPGVRLTMTVGGSPSTHDLVFLDADDDGFEDVILVNESGSSELFLNSPTNPGTFSSAGALPFAGALSGAAADFDLDGLDDVVMVSNTATIFFNNPTMPGMFTNANSLTLPSPIGTMYDVEVGDVDLDGSVDVVAVSLNGNFGANNAARVWLNNGTGTAFTDATGGMASTLLPGIGAYQRLSADLIDLELDGDLDLYLAGADTQDVGPATGCFWNPFGRVPNQLWENLLIP